MCYEALADGGALSPEPSVKIDPRKQQRNEISTHVRLPNRNRNVGVYASSASLPTYLTEVTKHDFIPVFFFLLSFVPTTLCSSSKGVVCGTVSRFRGRSNAQCE